ncbi:MAG: Predicted N-acetyl-glucosamine kinase 2, ROK family [uncultured Nocardioides sp.]|uniref:Predicted N-acetyl-glucosamine kinase 2, ROK family n=1 Tax=uncultured Nocardioides sp. TaxID=198441 RepID=A0A6J4N2U0_9ACTN|nr:MAG: Predicted N-acetyl-glucosamine kinase 2, ROK family [uncultured Nocardioides sp.]
MKLDVGLDVGATKTLGVAISQDGTIVAEVREQTRLGADGVVDTATRVFEALRAATGERLAGTVGVGVPGLVDVDLGAVKHAVNLGVDGEWLRLRDLLSQRLDLAVVVENDVNAAALGAGALDDAEDIAYISIGTGLAAGLVLGGRLRRGAHGAAGEVGHVPVDPRGVACQCGQRGCLETVASGSALATAWPTPDAPAAAALFTAAARGDAAAIVVRDRLCAGVASAARVLSLTVDPVSIVLGGGVAQVGEPLRVGVQQALRDQAAGSPFLTSLDLAGRVRVVPADYPVAAVGAALLGR